MINIKYCEDCGKTYDYDLCPYCNSYYGKGKKEDEENDNITKL